MTPLTRLILLGDSSKVASIRNKNPSAKTITLPICGRGETELTGLAQTEMRLRKEIAQRGTRKEYKNNVPVRVPTYMRAWSSEGLESATQVVVQVAESRADSARG